MVGALRTHKVFIIYILGFLYSLHFTLPIYINSSFLSLFATEYYVGVIYSISSILTILTFTFIGPFLNRYGNYKTAFIFFLIELICLIGLALNPSSLVTTVLFVISFVSVAILTFSIDVFLESYSSYSSVGKTRGIFLTYANLAWLIAPLAVSFIMTDSDYWKVYLAAAVLVVPILYIMSVTLRDFEDPEYEKIPFVKTFNQIKTDKNIYGIFIISFLLQFFFAWMVIYTPIYLHEYIKFEWKEIGLMLSIVLLPFVITEIPLGKLADTRWGEREMMSVGFLIIALSTALVSFVDSKSFLLWAAILLVTRVGASIVEVMSETYFFKKVDTSKVHLLSLFRTMRPFAYLLAPLVAISLFNFMEIKYIFVILGLIMFYGLRFSLFLDDTK
ncbi:MAG TPA: MFS transporter [Candidatus Paceibacterota bacterium]